MTFPKSLLPFQMAEEVYMFNSDDPESQAAYRRARETFRYFWREQFWEQRRIIPGLTVSCVKVPFSDSDLNDTDSQVEHMWINEIDFDGRNIHGTLINEPNWLKSVKVGDKIEVPVGAISDWMYAIGETVYGGFSVNAMRAKMGAKERAQHDNAWGLDFGDPNTELIVQTEGSQSSSKPGLLGKLFGRRSKAPSDPSNNDPLSQDHPMAVNGVSAYDEQISSDPEILKYVDEVGWTQLHHHALAGNRGIVELFLKHGAERETLTPQGVSAASLARVLGWEEVAQLIDG